MADVTIWLLAMLALLPPLAVPVIHAGRGDTASRPVAVQLVTAAAIIGI